MREYIRISLDYKNGDATLTRASIKIIEEMVSRAGILDYDQMSDMLYIFSDAFKRLQANYFKEEKTND